jgi:hypothetical protein
VRVARPIADRIGSGAVAHETEFSMLVVLRGGVTFESGDIRERLTESSSAAIPGGLRYALVDASADCSLLDVTLPADFAVAG